MPRQIRVFDVRMGAKTTAVFDAGFDYLISSNFVGGLLINEPTKHGPLLLGSTSIATPNVTDRRLRNLVGRCCLSRMEYKLHCAEKDANKHTPASVRSLGPLSKRTVTPAKRGHVRTPIIPEPNFLILLRSDVLVCQRTCRCSQRLISLNYLMLGTESRSEGIQRGQPRR